MISIHAPRAGRDVRRISKKVLGTYFNPRAPCGARHQQIAILRRDFAISIHAPRAGRDSACACVRRISKFQSTRPVRGATATTTAQAAVTVAFQSTRPVRGATCCRKYSLYCLPISIHAPRAGRDPLDDIERIEIYLFQSTRPVRGATTTICGIRTTRAYFNPRAPCGARHFTSFMQWTYAHFNPRAPCGARHAVTHTPH